ncbi:sigma-54 dependent transcriptional regulator [Acinetobacter sp. MD2]|uniref:sigma-54 interaction domain-containing protein n=1 Tax=Acinetobacter sp. MD2 TaxID=2600066 RepID=UPI002D1F5108|nr:sigma-54 dependent transcriptional regulator [Acinetobacter sp. MD2]MEB3766572.1 sigma-54-dependent Fis family transcriptional regulator [Acinetobacter sp. MD2]
MTHLSFDHLEHAQVFFQQLQQLFTDTQILVLNEQHKCLWSSDSCAVTFNFETVVSEHFGYILNINQQPGRLLLLPLQTVQKNTTTQSLSAEIQALAQHFNGFSPAMLSMFSIIQRVAKTQFPVLVRGESGSGKEWVARAIHEHSDRKQHPFIAINCASLNIHLLESELFGHVKGAFTGAIREHKGVFERANGGTLFLDEIAEIPLELQAKLLRVLETGEYSQLGGEKTLVSQVRIIAATHRALREEARLGRFRQDLLYRLRVIPIFVPPLRDRKSDLPHLIQTILTENCLYQQKTAPQLSLTALKTLVDYDWPGNIRELKNTLLYALTMAQGKTAIDVADLPYEISNLQPALDFQSHTPVLSPNMSKTELETLLKQFPHDLNQVANVLQISRTTLWRYRKKWGI